MRTNIVTVGLFDNFESFVGWAEELELKYLCTDSSKLETIRQGISSGILSLEIIICFDQVSQECKDLFADIHVRLLSFENFVRGDSSCGVSNVTPDDPCFLALTSGTTGPAKFCVVSHSNLMSNLSASLYLAQTITNEETYLSYLNFSLLGEILFIFLLAASEGRVGLARSPSSLSSDAQVLKPTMMLVVPRILEYIHDLIKSKVENLSGVSRSLYNRAFATKLKNYERTGALKHKIWDALVFGKAKNVLGGHLKIIVTGISMCPPDLVRFVRIVLGCDVLEGYGIIEAGISNFVSQPGDVLTGHIGGPLMNLEARLHYTGLLFDELSHYYGELYVRGPGVCSRYYKKGDVIHRNGWMATGDLVAIIPETGAFTFIDRIENIFKSRSGKCVCLQKLEVLYRTSKAVAQICCFSDIKIEGIIAVVVPDLEFVRTKWKTGNAERFCKSEEFSQAMIREFLVIERVYKLRPHEKVVKIVVELEPWTSEELVTPTLKIKRFMIRLKYADQIDKVIKDYISDF
jgi:long-chain acyl-CoA synthetase